MTETWSIYIGNIYPIEYMVQLVCQFKRMLVIVLMLITVISVK
jgi:hypothetical protein